ncbi:MAG: glycoside hydrolase family 25 protein [Kofleriaceae bacterium]
MAKQLRPAVIVAMAAAVLAIAVLSWPRRPDRVAPPVCELGPTVAGVDVSYHQEDIDWRRVRRAGMQFAFVRVSDGTTFADPKFQRNWAAARSAGVLRGAYQYFRPDESAIAQADLLIDALLRDPGELPPVIDVETAGNKTAAQIAERVQAWIDRVRARLGVEPMVYTGPDFWTRKVAGADFRAQPLWLAHYTAGCPTIPAPWTAWTFWQFSERGEVPGIDWPADMNWFAGTLEELQAFGRRSRLPRATGAAGRD